MLKLKTCTASSKTYPQSSKTKIMEGKKYGDKNVYLTADSIVPETYKAKYEKLSCRLFDTNIQKMFP